ncbi:MAG: hypothetical protein NTZ17_03805 [Phycisphaerae bacterium]|nr:hypothetical protein [Phycisphaerae bacterium]
MAKKIKQATPGKSETLYNQYFIPINYANEPTSLQQPSPLRNVQSFTTYAISDDLFIYRPVKQNA